MKSQYWDKRVLQLFFSISLWDSTIFSISLLNSKQAINVDNGVLYFNWCALLQAFVCPFHQGNSWAWHHSVASGCPQDSSMKTIVTLLFRYDEAANGVIAIKEISHEQMIPRLNTDVRWRDDVTVNLNTLVLLLYYLDLSIWVVESQNRRLRHWIVFYQTAYHMIGIDTEDYFQLSSL